MLRLQRAIFGILDDLPGGRRAEKNTCPPGLGPKRQALAQGWCDGGCHRSCGSELHNLATIDRPAEIHVNGSEMVPNERTQPSRNSLPDWSGFAFRPEIQPGAAKISCHA